MSRRHAGNYRDKHPAGTTADPSVAEAVSNEIRDYKIACRTAFRIAERLSVSPRKVGIAIDLQQGRIMACQLGLFGYGKDNKRVAESRQVEEALQSAISAELVDGRLPCEKAWGIADRANLHRFEVADACESLGIRICRCQLGAF